MGEDADHIILASGECGFFFNTNGAPQRSNWYEMWQSATAIWGICGMKHQQGIAFTGKPFSVGTGITTNPFLNIQA